MGDVRQRCARGVATAQEPPAPAEAVARAGMAALAVSGPVPRWLYAQPRPPLSDLRPDPRIRGRPPRGPGRPRRPPALRADVTGAVHPHPRGGRGARRLSRTSSPPTLAAKMLRPVTAWIDGNRTPESTKAALDGAGRHADQVLPPVGRVSLLCSAPADFGVHHLGARHAALRFLPGPARGDRRAGLWSLCASSRSSSILRPVLEDISDELPEDFEIERTGMPLK